jgi:serine/threonine protein phosphatase PrpC
MLYGVHQLDGRGRPSEDRVLIQKLLEGFDVFAVFDGHGGSAAVKLTLELLPKRLQAAIEAAGAPALLRNPGELATLLQREFIAHDKELARQLLKVRDSGSTASLVIVTPTHLIGAYLGDSPGFVFDPTTGLIQKEIGKHEPTLAGETERIQRAGGTVEIDEYGTPRVDGSLMVSRAFGDFSLKFDMTKPPPFESTDWSKMKVTASPDVFVWERPQIGVLALMSDGLVETDTNALKPTAQVAREIQQQLQANQFDLQRAAQADVMAHATAATRGRKLNTYDGDDLSLLLVDIGKQSAQSAQTSQAQQGGVRTLSSTLQAILHKPRTRKVKFGRRNKTGKKHRVIKILGF